MESIPVTPSLAFVSESENIHVVTNFNVSIISTPNLCFILAWCLKIHFSGREEPGISNRWGRFLKVLR